MKYIVAVVTNDEDRIEEILEPYSEELEVPKYLLYTKEQLIENRKKSMEEFKNGPYAEFLKNPIEFKNNCKDEAQIKFLEEEFPSRLNWTDEEIYQVEISIYPEKNIGKNGEVYSTYNPNSKWDWYTIIGSFTRHSLLTKEDNDDIIEPLCNTIVEPPKGYKWVAGAKIKDIDFKKTKEVLGQNFCTLALVDENGWYEQERTILDGIYNRKNEVAENFSNFLKKYVKSNKNQDKYLILVECHI